MKLANTAAQLSAPTGPEIGSRDAELPAHVAHQIDRLVGNVCTLLGNNVVGVYLHGSLAFGCSDPERRDIDLLVATEEPLDEATKTSLIRRLLAISRKPCDLEATLLRRSQLHPWTHPCPYELHYSEDWRPTYEDALIRNDPRAWAADQDGDIYLAAHLTNTLERGRCLFGEPASNVLPIVPRQDYEDFLHKHLQWARESAPYFPVYAVLSHCRGLAYLQEGRILSKEEGAAWASARLPENFVPTIAKALACYQAADGGPPVGIAPVRALLKHCAMLMGSPG